MTILSCFVSWMWKISWTMFQLLVSHFLNRLILYFHHLLPTDRSSETWSWDDEVIPFQWWHHWTRAAVSLQCWFVLHEYKYWDFGADEEEEHNLSSLNRTLSLGPFHWLHIDNFLIKLKKCHKRTKNCLNCPYLCVHSNVQISVQQVFKCLSFSHSSQETLLILLEGGQSRAYLQQRGHTLCRAARQQMPVFLNPKAVQGLVTHLWTTTAFYNYNIITSNTDMLETCHMSFFKIVACSHVSWQKILLTVPLKTDQKMAFWV